MLARITLLLVVLIVAVGVIECVWDLTPLEQARRAASWARTGTGRSRTLIRFGIASWQAREFPWDETIRRYEQDNPDVEVRVGALPEGFMNTMKAYWMYGHTGYDVIVAWADEEIYPFIDYKWLAPDPAQRSLIIDVRQHLSARQFAGFVPGLCVGSSRPDPDRPGEKHYYQLSWMGEALALNYNKTFFERAGVEKVPTTWEEVEAACAKLKGLTFEGRQIAPLAMNFSQKVFFAQNCYIPMLASFKAGRGVADADGRLDVTSPEAVRVFETLKRWHQAGYISPSCFVDETAEKDFRLLRAAIFPHWQSRGLEAVNDIDATRGKGAGERMIGIKPTPDAAVSGTLVSTYGCIIPKCSPVVSQAVKFAYEAFCTDKYGFQTEVARAGKLPSLKDVYQQPDLSPVLRELGESLNQGKGYFFPDLNNYQQCAQILVVEFQKYLDGDTPTAQAALANAHRRFQKEVYSVK